VLRVVVRRNDGNLRAMLPQVRHKHQSRSADSIYRPERFSAEQDALSLQRDGKLREVVLGIWLTAVQKRFCRHGSRVKGSRVQREESIEKQRSRNEKRVGLLNISASVATVARRAFLCLTSLVRRQVTERTWLERVAEASRSTIQQRRIVVRHCGRSGFNGDDRGEHGVPGLAAVRRQMQLGSSGVREGSRGCGTGRRRGKVVGRVVARLMSW